VKPAVETYAWRALLLLIVGVVCLVAGLELGIRILGAFLGCLSVFYALRPALLERLYSPVMRRLSAFELLLVVALLGALGALCLVSPGFVVFFAESIRR